MKSLSVLKKVSLLALTGLFCLSCSSVSTKETHTSLQKNWLEDEEWLDNTWDYADGTLELSRPEPVVFDISSKAENRKSYTLTLSETEDYSVDPWTYTISAFPYKFAVSNLKIKSRYYYHIVDDATGKDIEKGKFNTTKLPIRNLYIDGVTNARDIGGWETEDGQYRVKQGLLYRTAQLGSSSAVITQDGVDTMLNKLKVKTEIDFRPTTEVNVGYSFLGESVSYHQYQIYAVGSDYLVLNREEFKKAFELLCDENSYPAFFHCAIGTDRTGAFAYVLLGMLGVSYEDILKDYLFSNFGAIGSSRSMGQIALDQGTILDFGMVTDFRKNVTEYVKNNVHITDENVEKLRSILLEKI